jgi:DNA-binding transcriptional MerR regulator
MTPSLSIGDFARATHLSVKTLRFYHQSGILEPAEIDANSGYRRYSSAQIPTAQVIKRFRQLAMPLDDIRAILAAATVAERNELISGHLQRLEEDVSRTQLAVASLRDLLDHPVLDAPIIRRSVGATLAATISDVIDVKDAQDWYQGALGELYATLAIQGIEPTGTAGGLFATELFTVEHGAATVFVPSATTVRAVGRVTAGEIPAVELAIIEHPGPHARIDRAYGALGAHVADHALAVDGPLREYYAVGAHETPDATAWRTQIGWPIFATGGN